MPHLPTTWCRSLARVTIAAVAAAACSSCGVAGSRVGTGSTRAGDGGLVLEPGAACNTPGLLYCQGGAGSVVLFCGAAAGGSIDLDSALFTTVFQCPAAQACTADPGSTSIECSLPGSSQPEAYALLGAPCTQEQLDACSFDAMNALVCEGGVWQVKQACNGANCGLQRPDAAGCSAQPGSRGCIACL